MTRARGLACGGIPGDARAGRASSGAATLRRVLTNLWARRTIVRMDARWMPIVAAAIGLLGGLGGALVGGWLVNEGQEDAFKREQAAARKDLLIETYGTFGGTAEEVAVSLGADAPPAELRAAFTRLAVAKTRVFLVADNRKVERAAFATAKALEKANKASTDKEEQERIDDFYDDDLVRFVAVARDEINRAAE